MKLSPHFSVSEAACRCGRKECPYTEGKIRSELLIVTISYDTADMLEGIRSLLGGNVMHVNSWWRCPEHNDAVGGATGSLHMSGKAVDFTSRSLSARQVQAVLKTPRGRELARGLGRYLSFTHVDRRAKPGTWAG